MSSAPSSLRVSYGAQWVELRLGGSPPVLSVEASVTADLPGINGASISLDALLDITGLRSLTVSAQVGPADAATIGPLTFAPVVEIAVGPAAGPPRAAAGLVVADGAGTRAALLSIGLDPVSVSLRTRTNGTDDPAADPVVVITHVLVPLVADAALREPHVQQLLAMQAGSATLGGLLHGVVLTGSGTFDTGVLALDTSDLMTRLATLLANIARAAPPLALPDNLQLALAGSGASSGKLGIILSVTPGQRADLIPGGDIGLAFEVDDSWVNPALSPPGLSVLVADTVTGPRFIPPLITIGRRGVAALPPLRPADRHGDLRRLGRPVRPAARRRQRPGRHRRRPRAPARRHRDRAGLRDRRQQRRRARNPRQHRAVGRWR